MPKMTRRAIAALTLLPLALVPGCVAAQEAYPSRPLKLVVPFPPGGLTDVLGRAIAERLGAALKQPVVVENRPGAGTLLGAELVAKSPADGYTLLHSTSSTFGIAPAMFKSPKIEPLKDFIPVTLIGTVNFFLIGSPDIKPRTLAELIAEMKANPGKYNYASVGNGSAHHLFIEDFKKRTGVEAQHVPYKGTGEALQDLIPNRVQIMFSDAAVALPQIEAKKVIAFGTSGAKQNTLVPSVRPIGASVPGFDWQAWQGISVPAGTPAAIVERLSKELLAIQQAAEFQTFLTKIGMEPWAPLGPAQFAEHVKAEIPRWADAVKAAGAKLD